MRKERRDAYLLEKVDGLHTIFPYVMPNRTDAEISMTEAFDVTDLNKYMADANGAYVKVYIYLLLFSRIFQVCFYKLYIYYNFPHPFSKFHLVHQSNN